MKEYTSTQHFAYPWEYVTAANWRKYPNEVSTHVVAVDVLRREFDVDRQILRTERLITCKQPIPGWLKYIVGNADTSYVREVSIIDRLGKTLTMRSVNLTLAKLLKVYETVIYSPDDFDPLHKTKFIQNARFESNSGWKSLENKVEAWGVDRFSQNASKGKLGFESVLKLGMLQNNFTEKLSELSFSASVLFDEINLKTTNAIDDLNKVTDEILRDIDQSTVKLLSEIKQCNVFKDINDISLDLLKDMGIRSGNALSELNNKSKKVVTEVNQMTDTFLNDMVKDVKIIDQVNEKTELILKEFDNKKLEITRHVNSESKLIFDALSCKTSELLQDLSRVQPQSIPIVMDENMENSHEQSISKGNFLQQTLTKITNIFSKD